MRKSRLWALGALLGTLGLFLGLTSPVQSQRPVGDRTSVRGRIINATKLQGKDVDKFLAALGPAVRDLLANGQQVPVPGLGSFRVVAVPAHRDMVAGRPVVVPGSNYVEFIPSAELNAAANAGGAMPAEVVVPFQYNPLPNQVKSPHVGTSRMPPVRTR